MAIVPREALESVGMDIIVDGRTVHVTRREGASENMIAHVVKVYRLVSAALAAGHLTVTRNIAPFTVASHERGHSQNRVTLWGNAEYKGMKVSLHAITEYSSANDILDAIAMMGAGVKDGLSQPLPPPYDKPAAPAPAQDSAPLATTPDEWDQHRESNGGQVDLKKQFPAHQPTPPAAPAKPKGKPRAVDSKEPNVRIEQYSYKEQDEYESLYTGQSVDVLVGSIRRAVKAKKDGTGSYEVYEVYPANSQYEAFTLNTFVPAAGDMKQDWTVFKTLAALMPNPGTSITGDIVLTYKLNPDKTGQKVYWNITAIGYDPETTSAGVDTEEPEYEYDASNIPF